MAHEIEMLNIIRHISSVYQDLNDDGSLSMKEIAENEEIGDEVADILVKSLSLEVIGTDGDFITVRIKPVDDTWPLFHIHSLDPLFFFFLFVLCHIELNASFNSSATEHLTHRKTFFGSLTTL